MIKYRSEVLLDCLLWLRSVWEGCSVEGHPEVTIEVLSVLDGLLTAR